MSCSRTQRSDAGESRIRGPSVDKFDKLGQGPAGDEPGTKIAIDILVQY